MLGTEPLCSVWSCLRWGRKGMNPNVLGLGWIWSLLLAHCVNRSRPQDCCWLGTVCDSFSPPQVRLQSQSLSQGADGQTESRGILSSWFMGDGTGIQRELCFQMFFQGERLYRRSWMGAEGCTVGVAMCPQLLFLERIYCHLFDNYTIIGKRFEAKKALENNTFLLHYALLTYLSSWLFTVCWKLRI